MYGHSYEYSFYSYLFRVSLNYICFMRNTIWYSNIYHFISFITLILVHVHTHTHTHTHTYTYNWSYVLECMLHKDRDFVCHYILSTWKDFRCQVETQWMLLIKSMWITFWQKQVPHHYSVLCGDWSFPLIPGQFAETLSVDPSLSPSYSQNLNSCSCFSFLCSLRSFTPSLSCHLVLFPPFLKNESKGLYPDKLTPHEATNYSLWPYFYAIPIAHFSFRK